MLRKTESITFWSLVALGVSLMFSAASFGGELRPKDSSFDNSTELARRWNAGESVPDDEYYCHKPITIRGKSVVSKSTLRFTCDNTWWLLVWRDVQDCVLADLTIVGTNSAGTPLGVYSDAIKDGYKPPGGVCIRNARSCFVRNVTSRNTVCQGFNISDVDGLVLTKCTAKETGKDGIFFAAHKAESSFIRNVTIDENECEFNGDDQIAIWAGPNQAATGTPRVWATGIVVTNNTIVNHKHPKVLGVGIRLCGVDGAIVSGNRIGPTAKAGIQVSNWSRSDKIESRNVVITGNVFSGIGTADGGLEPRQSKRLIEIGATTNWVAN